MEGEWSRYRSGHFNGRKMVMLQRWSVLERENGHITLVVSLRENDHVTEVDSLMEGEWSCSRGGH